MGTTAQKLEYLNTTKGYIKNSINLTGANITNEPFRNYAVILKDTLASLLKDPTPIWTNFPKVEDTGTSFTISAYNSLFEMKLSGDTAQSGTPAPDNEVPVQTVSGRQVIAVNSNSYNIDLTGKNLFDYTQTITTYSGSSSVPIENGIRVICINAGTYKFVVYKIFDATDLVGEQFTLSLHCQSSGSNNYQVNVIMCDELGTNRQTVKSIPSIENINETFTIPSISGTSKYLGINFYSTAGASANVGDYIDYTNIQLEKGNTKTSYSSYFTPIELCKIGDYEDRIYKSNGKWYLHKEIGKVVLNGSENWGKSGATSIDRFYYQIQTGTLTDYNIEVAKSNYFNYGYALSQIGKFYLGAYQSNTRIFFDYSTYNTTTLAQWKTWLGNNNTTVYYALTTITDEEITNSDLINQLDSVALANGTNVITVSGTLPAILYIKALEN